MDILIVGAGIGGLTAAIALRRQGHRVTVLEQSRLNQETGAAIFLPPNANGLLRDCGFVPEQYGANWCLGWRHLTADGQPELVETFKDDEYPNPWQMIHRQELHRGLKAIALDASGAGSPAIIRTSSRVASVDADTTTLTLENGTKMHADVIVGADGMHSKVRAAVQQKYGTAFTPFLSGMNAFRFLIERETLLADPATKSTFDIQDTLQVWHGAESKLVSYPCDNNVTMNFVAIHPAKLSDASGKDWNSQGSKETLLSIYSDFTGEVKAALAHVDQDKIKLYPLMDMKQLPGWTNGNLALIGDAAHPFLPHLGQGGAQAIEDAVSLGVLLPPETTAVEIPRRLQLYELARKERAHNIQSATRQSGSATDEGEHEKLDYDRIMSREYQFRHDEVAHSTQILQAHLAELAT